MRPNQTILVLEDLRKTFSGPLYRKGVELDSRDGQTVLDVYQQWLALMMDIGYLHHDSLWRQGGRLWSDMTKADVLYLNNAFADLLALVRAQSRKGFKALCSEISPHLYSLLKDDIELISTGDVFAAKRLIQCFSYTSRLSLKHIDLEKQLLDEYLEIEDSFVDDYPKHIIRSLNKTIKRWLKDFDPDRIQFGHGPGGVAGLGRATIEAKYKDLASDQLLNYAFGDPWWVQSPVPSNLDRISQTIFVAKSYKTFRTISMEPSALMYVQRGVMKEIQRVVETDRYLQSHIGFKKQGRNQVLAKEGSFSRNYATIDLSSASDTVSYSLVKKLFRGTKLLRFIVATRSPRTLLPDGRLITLKKFAPMGSALCFPVEMLVFAAICQYVTREHRVTADYSVYGDDLIVPTQCAPGVMKLLDRLGFRVNHPKSFTDPQCWFRESCGADYCDGFDVTPIKISRDYTHDDEVERLKSLVSLANSAYDRGFRNLRYVFIAKMMDLGFSPLFAPTEMKGDNYSNWHLTRRWNTALQKIEAQIKVFVPEQKAKQEEETRYRHWLESTQMRLAFEDGFLSYVGKSPMIPKDQWRDKPYEDLDSAFIDHFTLKR